MISNSEKLKFLRPEWAAPVNVRAFTSTRLGGVSQMPYSGLNLGAHVGDDPKQVDQNREILRQALSLPSEPIWLNQIHGTDIVEFKSEPSNLVNVDRVSADRVSADRVSADRVSADGAYTRSKNLVCCIMTADCLPLFLCDVSGEQVGVIHAGWRGIANGIVENAIDCFKQEPDQILAWAGPSIGFNHFEVGAEVRDALGGSEECWRKSSNKDKYYCDLTRLVEERLTRVGVTSYGHSEYCTFEDDALFYSHRRDGLSGRMASLIYLSDSIHQ